MNNIRFIFMLALIPCLMWGQKLDTIYYRLDNKLGTSKISTYYTTSQALEDDRIEVKEYYRFTKPHSLKSWYFIDSNGLKQGKEKKYNKEGFVVSEGAYENDLKEGLWLFYRKGQLQRKVLYMEDKAQGIAHYFEEGKEIYTWNWKDDESEGYNERFYKDGTSYFKGNYVGGQREGEHVYYYKGGKVKSKSFYANGNREGESLLYYENGQVQCSGFFSQGKSSNIWEWYREDGTLASKEQYNKAGKIKKLTFFDNTGVQVRSRKKDLYIGVIEQRKKLQRVIESHIRNNFDFPEIMRKEGFEGRVFVSFVYDENGEVANIDINSDAHQSFEIASKSIIASLPKQEKPMAHNLPISAKFNIPITFKIE